MGAETFGYLVGGLSSATKSNNSAKRSRPTPDTAADPSAAEQPAEVASQGKAQKRRRRATMRDHGDEFMNMNIGITPDWGDPSKQHPAATTAASSKGAGSLGFAGTRRDSTTRNVAGLTTLAGDEFGERPQTPLLPETWRDDTHD